MSALDGLRTAPGTLRPPDANDPTYRRIRDTLLTMGLRQPQFLLIWDRIRGRVQIGDRWCDTLAVDDAGTLYVSPRFVGTLQPAELAGVLAHELLHLVFQHHKRQHGRDQRFWNVAGDMVINAALREDGIQLPAGALYPPEDYAGSLDCEALFDHLWANRPKPQPQPGKPKGEPGAGAGRRDPSGTMEQPGEQGEQGEQGEGDPDRDAEQEGPGSPSGAPLDDDQGEGEGEGGGAPEEGASPVPEDHPAPGEGCGVLPAPEPGEQGPNAPPPGTPGTPGAGQLPEALRPGESWDDVRAFAEQALEGIGAGSSAIRRLLAPTPSRANWRQILRRGAQIAQATRERETPTYARASRRQIPGVIRSGWRSNQPRLAVILDTSGSMDRAWLDQVVGECITIAKTFQGIRVYVVAHTSRVTWEGWIDEGKPGSWDDAISSTGGTDARPAYAALDQVPGAPFDALIHFTDCEIAEWPRAERCKRHLIGACGPGADGRPWAPFPAWAEVIPVTL